MKRLNKKVIPISLYDYKNMILGDKKNNIMYDCLYNNIINKNIQVSTYENTQEIKDNSPSTLKSYQLKDLQKSLCLDAIFNINKPGYGKTLETIIWLRIRLCRPFQVLILCPKSVIETWLEQLKRYWPTYDREGYWFITNYEQLYNNSRFQHCKSVGWDAIVLDESHRIKSMSSKITRLVFQLNSTYRHCLTGTPIKNRPEDLAAQLKWLDNASITSYTDFVFAFCYLVQDQWGYKPMGLTRNSAMVSQLQKLLSCYCVGGEEHSVTEPPEYIKIRLQMHPTVKDFYNKVVGEYDDQLKTRVIDTEYLLNNGIKVSSAIEAATRRQQLASNPQLFNTSWTNVKFDWIIDWLNDTDQKVVILSKFAKTIEMLEKRLLSNKITYKCIKSEMNSAQRQVNIYAFVNHPYRALIGTFGVLKEGIDGLQKACHYMIFVDRQWTASDNEQAEKRIMRIGQQHQCVFYILQCTGTIDVKIEKTQLDKGHDIKELLEPVSLDEI